MRWLLGAALGFALLYATGINRNLFFLAFGLSCTAVAVVWANSALVRLAAAIVFLASAAVTVSAPLPPRVDVQAGLTDGLRKLPAGVPVIFRFQLHGIEQHRAKCGPLDPYAIVVGAGLTALDVSVNGAAPLGIGIEYARDVNQRVTAWVRLPDDVKDAVELKLIPREEVALYQGPEVSGHDVYPDAVYLMFANTECRVVYHVRRTPND
ncbi:MAG TPA: hypothetical protein VJT13_11400 [Xanthobacteraceae bacterium]|nr:hypothetical protein [Xanthobacteraceae bacterium]